MELSGPLRNELTPDAPTTPTSPEDHSLLNAMLRNAGITDQPRFFASNSLLVQITRINETLDPVFAVREKRRRIAAAIAWYLTKEAAQEDMCRVLGRNPER